MENVMSNPQDQPAGRPMPANKTNDLLKQRLDELLLQRGNITYRIETLKIQLSEIDDELDGLNHAAPFMRIVEAAIISENDKEK